MPIFIYAIIAFIYFIQILGLQESLQNAITETGSYASKFAYVYEYLNEYDQQVSNYDDKNEQKNINNNLETVIAQSIDSTFYKIKMQDFLNVEEIDHSCIQNGFYGIHTYLSSYMTEDNTVDIILTYHIKLPLIFIHLDSMPMVQRVRLRGWSGHKVAAKNSINEIPSDDQTTVYITETGKVYHLTKECTHIKLSVKEIPLSQLSSMRNNYGSIYKECSLCDIGKLNNKESVYITDTGDRYHRDLNCSGLKRTIISIPLSEVGGRNVCTRCGKKQ